jgi:hypothetical protein
MTLYIFELISRFGEMPNQHGPTRSLVNVRLPWLSCGLIGLVEAHEFLVHGTEASEDTICNDLVGAKL